MNPLPAPDGAVTREFQKHPAHVPYPTVFGGSLGTLNKVCQYQCQPPEAMGQETLHDQSSVAEHPGAFSTVGRTSYLMNHRQTTILLPSS